MNFTTTRYFVFNHDCNSSMPTIINIDKRRTQHIMQELTNACQQNPACGPRAIPTPFDRIACIRKCVSPSCYSAIYGSQPLEPGEIDVKYSQYKACFHQHWKHRYVNTYNELNEV